MTRGAGHPGAGTHVQLGDEQHCDGEGIVRLMMPSGVLMRTTYVHISER
jgi:hypothetical protein